MSLPQVKLLRKFADKPVVIARVPLAEFEDSRDIGEIGLFFVRRSYSSYWYKRNLSPIGCDDILDIDGAIYVFNKHEGIEVPFTNLKLGRTKNVEPIYWSEHKSRSAVNSI